MSHHHGPAPTGPTCTAFLGTFLGVEVALIRDRKPKIIGELVHVGETDDEHDPILVVAVDGDVRQRARFSELTRARMHTTPNPKDRT